MKSVWTRVAAATAVMLVSMVALSAQMKKDAPKAGMMPVADAIKMHENEVQQAILKNDIATLKKYVAADAWLVDENGPMSAADFFKIADFKGVYARPGEMKVAMLDANSYLVTYRLEQKGGDAQHPWPPVTYASTVWTKKAGAWQAVYHQETAATKH